MIRMIIGTGTLTFSAIGACHVMTSPKSTAVAGVLERGSLEWQNLKLELFGMQRWLFLQFKKPTL